MTSPSEPLVQILNNITQTYVVDAQKGRPTETGLLNTQIRQLFKMNTPQIIFIQDMCCECSRRPHHLVGSFEAQSKQMLNPPHPHPRHQIFAVDAQEGCLTEMVLLRTQNR